MVFHARTGNLRGRICLGRTNTSNLEDARAVIEPSPQKPWTLDCWLQPDSRPAWHALAKRTSNIDFWGWLQPELGARDPATQSSILDFWWWLQPEFGASDPATQSSNLDFWSWLQPESGASDHATESSEVDFWALLQPELGASDPATQSSNVDFWIPRAFGLKTQSWSARFYPYFEFCNGIINLNQPISSLGVCLRRLLQKFLCEMSVCISTAQARAKWASRFAGQAQDIGHSSCGRRCGNVGRRGSKCEVVLEVMFRGGRSIGRSSDLMFRPLLCWLPEKSTKPR